MVVNHQVKVREQWLFKKKMSEMSCLDVCCFVKGLFPYFVPSFFLSSPDEDSFT